MTLLPQVNGLALLIRRWRAHGQSLGV